MERKADISIGRLGVWVLGREFPNSDCYWDANWLTIRAEIDTPGSRVTCSGPWLRTDELSAFAAELETSLSRLAGTARLNCIEPYLEVEVRFTSLGHADLDIDITPDPGNERHTFNLGTDQSYLAATLREIRATLREYPIIATPPAQPIPSKPALSRSVWNKLADVIFGPRDNPT